MIAEMGPEIDVEEVVGQLRRFASDVRVAPTVPSRVASHQQSDLAGRIETEAEISSPWEISAKSELPGRTRQSPPPVTDTFRRFEYPETLEVHRRFRDLVVYSDRTFVEAAYRAVLRRPADLEGAETYTHHLRNGMSKAEIVRILQDSPEGRRIGASMPGVSRSLLAQRMRNWPVIGRPVAVVLALWDLADASYARSRFEGSVWAQIDDAHAAVKRLYDIMNQALGEIQSDMLKLQTDLVASRCAVSQINTSLRKIDKTKAAADDVARLFDAMRGVQQSKADDVSVVDELREMSA